MCLSGHVIQHGCQRPLQEASAQAQLFPIGRKRRAYLKYLNRRNYLGKSEINFYLQN